MLLIRRQPLSKASQWVQLHWRWRARRPGRTRLGTEIRDLIV
jgi:hypothetical protein